MSYTPNPFDLLGDEGDVRPRKQTVKAPKPATQPAAPKPQQDTQQQKAAAPAKPSPSNAKRDSDAKAKTQDAPKGKTDAQIRKPAAQPRPQQQQGAAPVRADANYESEKPQRAPKDKRDTRERPPQRGRQNDRKSATGRPVNENKRSGSGKANWGTIEDGQESATEATKELTEGEKEEVVAVEGEAAAEPPKEPEKELKSLDEYYESIKGKAVKSVEAPKLRSAGEGVDQSAWADYAPISKDDEEDAPKKKKTTSVKKETSNGKEEKVAVDKLFNISLVPPAGIEERQQRGGDRRGGRGGKGPSRGGRGGGRSQQQTPKADKEKILDLKSAEFPALGGSAPSPAVPQQSNPPAAVKA